MGAARPVFQVRDSMSLPRIRRDVTGGKAFPPRPDTSAGVWRDDDVARRFGRRLGRKGRSLMFYRQDNGLVVPHVKIECHRGDAKDENPNGLHGGITPLRANHTPEMPRVILGRTYRFLHLESEENGRNNQRVSDPDIPTDRRAKKNERDNREDHQCDAFLQNLQLRHGPFIRSRPVCRNLEEVLEKGDAPARQNDNPERLVPELQMAIPCKVHENV